jgi:hypothetical protein
MGMTRRFKVLLLLMSGLISRKDIIYKKNLVEYSKIKNLLNFIILNLINLVSYRDFLTLDEIT